MHRSKLLKSSFSLSLFPGHLCTHGKNTSMGEYSAHDIISGFMFRHTLPFLCVSANMICISIDDQPVAWGRKRHVQVVPPKSLVWRAVSTELLRASLGLTSLSFGLGNILRWGCLDVSGVVMEMGSADRDSTRVHPRDSMLTQGLGETKLPRGGPRCLSRLVDGCKSTF